MVAPTDGIDQWCQASALPLLPGDKTARTDGDDQGGD